MEHNFILYISIFAIAFFVALVSTPLAKKIAIKFNAIDEPKARGLHKSPKPRMGGLAIILGFFVALLVAMPFVEELRTIQVLGFTIGALFIIVLGIFDDIYQLSAKIKLVVQILSAVIVVYTGTTVTFVSIEFLDRVQYLSPVITVIWIVGLTNAVNILDGVDGLAAGVTAICSSCLFVLCIISGSPLAVIFTASLAGSCLGFLPRNFSPAELFMGDTGSTFLGYVLAVSSIIGLFKGYAILSIVIAVFSMALPIVDTTFAMLRRFFNGKPIMQADRGHLHHRLVDRGYSHKKTVLILYSISAVSGIIAILLSVQSFESVLVMIVFLIILMSMIFVYRSRLAQRNKDDDNNI